MIKKLYFDFRLYDVHLYKCQKWQCTNSIYKLPDFTSKRSVHKCRDSKYEQTTRLQIYKFIVKSQYAMIIIFLSETNIGQFCQEQALLIESCSCNYLILLKVPGSESAYLYSLYFISAVTYYCENEITDISGVASGTLRSVYDGQSNYGSSQTCRWRIDSRTSSGRVMFTVTRSDLQWAPSRSICTNYDYVAIHSGMFS